MSDLPGPARLTYPAPRVRPSGRLSRASDLPGPARPAFRASVPRVRPTRPSASDLPGPVRPAYPAQGVPRVWPSGGCPARPTYPGLPAPGLARPASGSPVSPVRLLGRLPCGSGLPPRRPRPPGSASGGGDPGERRVAYSG
ncbi:hypothetical protein Aph02nite_37890 [Actinoplanes philippinensis]|nr:hypothetical protein Aph02nite_37890 [Actinoplanes philippinensis]